MNLPELLKLTRHGEARKVDFIFLADVAAVRHFDDRRVLREREQQSSRLEPFTLLAALAAQTRSIGLVGTASTTYQHPYTFARRLSTLDHISRGRAGWNMVTSTHADEAFNYGLDRPLGSDERHARAHEFASVLKALFDTWDDDAWPRDKATGQYFDRNGLHDLDHDGAHFRIKGPLDTPRPPQGIPPIATAGASANAQELAAAHADIVYASQADLASALAYSGSVRARLATYGREPDEIKIFQGIYALVGKTRGEAEANYQRLREVLIPEQGLGLLIASGFPDLRDLPLDEPVPDLMELPDVKLGGKAAMVRGLSRFAAENRLTVRDLSQVIMGGGLWQQPVLGTAKDVADTMEEWFSTGAADGFNLQSAYQPKCAIDYLDEVIPELQRRGLFRREYEGVTLRDRLNLPRPPSRHVRATEPRGDVP
jgi:FMN-dependent oxidoreductase (nitrilotriacetate monooxygenase family)